MHYTQYLPVLVEALHVVVGQGEAEARCQFGQVASASATNASARRDSSRWRVNGLPSQFIAARVVEVFVILTLEHAHLAPAPDVHAIGRRPGFERCSP